MGVFLFELENSIKESFEIRHDIYLVLRPTGDYTLITQFEYSMFQEHKLCVVIRYQTSYRY